MRWEVEAKVEAGVIKNRSRKRWRARLYVEIKLKMRKERGSEDGCGNCIGGGDEVEAVS